MELTTERLRYIIELGDNPEIANLIRMRDDELLTRLIKSYKEIQEQIYPQSDSAKKRV